MMLHALSLFGFLAVVNCASQDLTVKSHWNGGFSGTIHIHSSTAVQGWTTHIVFSKPCTLEIWTADIVSHSGDNTEWVIKNKPYDANIDANGKLDVDIVGRCDGSDAPTAKVFIEGQGGGSSSSGGGNPATSAPSSGGGNTGGGGGGNPVTDAPVNPGGPVSAMKYDYKNALGLSILFFDAQRSGRMPSNNPVPWRHDSAVNDHGDGGVDLSGGWYDAGDHVKFNLPMSSSAHILGYGLYKWKDAYQAAGQLNNMYDMLRTPLEYFLKCWRPDSQEYYAQVGNGAADHAFWGRPEDMTMNRPAYKCTASSGGCSDVEGGTAAAMAAGAIAFKGKDDSFAAKLLSSAKSLYQFAKTHKGIYNKGPIGDATSYYGSNGYNDELCMAAMELHKATGDDQYLNDAKGFYEAGVGWALSWDDEKIFCQLLLYGATQDAKYKADIDGFVKAYMPGGSVQHTPCGLAWRDKWGSLRYAGNAAFVACAAANMGIGGDAFKKFAMSQINYILGDNKQHMSFEIGFGSNYPKQPHHRSSSCPSSGGCGWNEFNNNGPSPQTLKGALVGGPDAGDNYHDSRKDYVSNEVTCDYNAGFQSALAGLVHFAVNGHLPAAPAAKC